jgi:RNA polymerase sigma-70 factor (ECF subfamily)
MVAHLSSVLEAPTPLAGPSDEDLLDAMIGGSSDAVAMLYDRHAALVYRAALRVTTDHAIAAEVVQETFLSLWNRAELFDRSRGALVAWLTTIARNRAIDQLRSARRHDRAVPFSTLGEDHDGPDDRPIAEWAISAGALIGSADPERTPEAAVAERERRDCLERAIATLGSPERAVIQLAYGGGLTQTEIAERLEWPLGTVKTRTRRALQHLRARLADPTSAPCSELIGEG